MIFGTKANTLRNLAPQIKTAIVLPQFVFTVKEWESDPGGVLNRLSGQSWAFGPLIVRSSALNEDSVKQSMAGKYISVPNVSIGKEFTQAIHMVIASYDEKNDQNQVLIQPFLRDVRICGVAFSVNPNNGGQYIVINYDESSGSSSSVTSGNLNLNTLYVFKKSPVTVEGIFQRVVDLVRELESICAPEHLDIEFVIDSSETIYLLQVRPLILTCKVADLDMQYSILEGIFRKIESTNEKKPYLYGDKTIYGVMPDWNPAELIGIRPRPLALSLYKELITDRIWAYQRDNYGYRNLRSFPLLISFCGSPYIDVRVSFNSFLPKSLDAELSEKLIKYYMKRLNDNPSFHDKVEFEIIFSCFTFDLPDRVQMLKDYDFTEEEIASICDSLKALTNKIISMDDGLLMADYRKVEELEVRRQEILNSNLDKISKIYWLIEDCKRYGTLPFAGLARGAFIAIQLLNSLVQEEIITHNDLQKFMGELNTISSCMINDLHSMDESSFLRNYGHLRPGTYDIMSKRYDEEPTRYFDFSHKHVRHLKKNEPFSLTLKQLNQINKKMDEMKYTGDVLKLFDFIKKSIEGREYSKFIFTKSLSDVLKLLSEVATDHGFSTEEASYLNIGIIKQIYDSDNEIQDIFSRSIEEGKVAYSKLLQVNLPPLITSPEDVWHFQHLKDEPNFITIDKALGRTIKINDNEQNFQDKILLIPNADPGFDWIFSKNISGFITMYGGANSHMAIRANELGIPAVIGSGEKLFTVYEQAEILEINCAERQVRIIQ